MPIDDEQAARHRPADPVEASAVVDLADRLLSVIDLTTLEGRDTPGRVRALCETAKRPDADDPSVPPVAAVCVYPSLVPVAVEALAGSPVRVASVAGGFPAGQIPRSLRVAEIAWVVAQGATEVDAVLDRGAFLDGRFDDVLADVAASKAACGTATLKLILETGELGSYAAIRHAARLALEGGADVVKSSTGKLTVADPHPEGPNATGATPGVAWCLATAVRDHAERTGRVAGIKLAGGIRTFADAHHHLAVVEAVLGPAATTPDRFRIGASALVADVVAHRRSAASRAAANGEHGRRRGHGPR
jgi:deoxyribose-phosphate aldolase